MFLTGSRDGRAILWDLRIGTRDRGVHDIVHPFTAIPHSNHPLVAALWSNKKRKLGPVAKQVRRIMIICSSTFTLFYASVGGTEEASVLNE